MSKTNENETVHEHDVELDVTETAGEEATLEKKTPEVEDKPEDEILKEGTEVIVSGLESENGKKLNGQKGHVLAWIPSAGRYLLELRFEKFKKRIKPINVKPTGSSVPLSWDSILQTSKLLKRPIPDVREKRVDICKFQFGKQIGKGPISRIILATKEPGYYIGEDPDLETFALKIISKKDLREKREARVLQKSLVCEKKTMYKCRDIHPFILTLYATARGVDDVFFILEHAPNRDLQKWAMELGGLPESCVRFYTACIIEALEAMHEVGVYHRDVKPENVFLDKDFLPKLGDFGCSICEDDPIYFMGTPQYISPEMVRHKVTIENVRASDYWGLGATVYYLLWGQLCFSGGHDYTIMTKAANGDYTMPENGDFSTKDFIKKLLVVKIEERLGWAGGWPSVKQHDVFENIDWAKLQANGPPVKFWNKREVVDLSKQAIKE